MWLVRGQIRRLEAKVERLQGSVSDLSNQLLESKSKEILSVDRAEKLERELELMKVRTKAWMEQMEAEKAGVIPSTVLTSPRPYLLPVFKLAMEW
jgi:chromosome segregation ATPase